MGWRNGVVPDPFVAGPAGPAAFVIIASVAAIGYAIVVAMSVADVKRA